MFQRQQELEGGYLQHQAAAAAAAGGLPPPPPLAPGFGAPCCHAPALGRFTSHAERAAPPASRCRGSSCLPWAATATDHRPSAPLHTLSCRAPPIPRGADHPDPMRDCILLCSCGEAELLPQNPDLPADTFTSCLTTPIKARTRTRRRSRRPACLCGLQLQTACLRSVRSRLVAAAWAPSAPCCAARVRACYNCKLGRAAAMRPSPHPTPPPSSAAGGPALVLLTFPAAPRGHHKGADRQDPWQADRSEDAAG